MNRSLTLLTITLVSFLSFQYAFTMNKAIESIQQDSRLNDDKKRQLVEEAQKARKLIEQEAFKAAFLSFDYHFALMGFKQSDFPLTGGRSRDEKNAQLLIADTLINGDKLMQELLCSEWVISSIRLNSEMITVELLCSNIADMNGRIRNYQQYLFENSAQAKSDEVKAYELLSILAPASEHKNMFITNVLHWIEVQDKEKLRQLVHNPVALKTAYLTRERIMLGKDSYGIEINPEILELIPIGQYIRPHRELKAADAAAIDCAAKAIGNADSSDKAKEVNIAETYDSFTTLVLHELLYLIYNHKNQETNPFTDTVHNSSDKQLVTDLLKLLNCYSEIGHIEADKLLYSATEWDVVPLMQAVLLFIVAHCDEQELMHITNNMHWLELKRYIEILPFCTKTINKYVNKELPTVYDNVAVKAVKFIIQSICYKILQDELFKKAHSGSSTSLYSKASHQLNAYEEEVIQALVDQIPAINTFGESCLELLLKEDAVLIVDNEKCFLKESAAIAQWKAKIREKLNQQLVLPNIYRGKLYRDVIDNRENFQLLSCSFLNPTKLLFSLRNKTNCSYRYFFYDLIKNVHCEFDLKGNEVDTFYVLTSSCQCLYDKQEKQLIFGNYDINADIKSEIERRAQAVYDTEIEHILLHIKSHTKIAEKWGKDTRGFDWPLQPRFVKAVNKGCLLIADEMNAAIVTLEGALLKEFKKNESGIRDISIDETSILIVYHDNSIAIYDRNTLQITRIIKTPAEIEEAMRFAGESPLVAYKGLNAKECIVSYANNQVYIYDKKEVAKEPYLLNSLSCNEQSSMRTALMPEGHAISFAHINEHTLAIGFEGGTVKIIDRAARTYETIECDYNTHGCPMDISFDGAVLCIIYSKNYIVRVFLKNEANSAGFLDSLTYYQSGTEYPQCAGGVRDISESSTLQPLCTVQKIHALISKKPYLLDSNVVMHQNKHFCYMYNIKSKKAYCFESKKLAQAAVLDDHTIADYDPLKQQVVFMNGNEGKPPDERHHYWLASAQQRRDAFYWRNQPLCMCGLSAERFIIADEEGIFVVDRTGKIHYELEANTVRNFQFKQERSAKVKELIVDKGFIIALYADGTLKIWDRNTYEYISSIALPTDIPCKEGKFQGKIRCLPLNNEKIIVSYSDGSARIFDIRTAALESQYIIPGNNSTVTCFAQINERYLALGYKDGFVRFFDKASKKSIRTIAVPSSNKNIFNLSILPVLLALTERQTLLIAYKGINTIFEWDIKALINDASL